MTEDRNRSQMLAGCVLRTVPWADGQELVRGTHPGFPKRDPLRLGTPTTHHGLSSKGCAARFVERVRRAFAGATARATQAIPAAQLQPIRVFLALLPLLLLGGCESRALEEAQQEARDAQVTIEKLKYNLNEANREISRLKAELGAVRQTRDEVQDRIVQLIEERDQASALAEQAQNMVAQLTTRASGQATAATALEEQIAELKALVEDQQKLIEQLQKGAPAEPPTEVAGEPLPAVEPNQTP